MEEVLILLHCYWPEMGDNVPTQTIKKQYNHLTSISQAPIKISAQIGHYGGWYVKTKIELKGRGIRKLDEDTYKLTSLAFEKLRKQHEIKMECYLD